MPDKDRGGYIVRQCLHDESAGVIQRLHKMCFPYDASFKPTVGWWWLVWKNGEVVGFAGMHRSTQWGDTMYLVRAGILPAHRGRGLQQRLIKARLKAARDLEANWVVTDTRLNPPSANNLINAGFRMFLPSRPWAFQDSCYWVKKIER